MSDVTDLDMLDYALLKVMADEGKPLWKKRVHEHITERYGDFPQTTPNVSVQTIGRRVDRLASKGLAENLIIEPDNLNRNMVIAYTLTDDGEDALRRKQEMLLKQVIRHNIFPEDEDPHLSKTALIEVMQDFYEFEDTVKDQFTQYAYEEIITFLTIRYARKNTVDVLDDGHLSKYNDLLDEHNNLLDALGLQQQ